MNSDTIAAIATPMTNSGIGIIRISGIDALDIIDKIYRSKNKCKRISEQNSHTAHYGYIADGKEIIDEVIVLIMKGPNSYTKEDVVEIDCHGGVLVMRRILETVIKYGARPAEPGEFTKRAFLNGRIDLSQAEAVIDIINSKNDYALTNSVSQLKGSLSIKIEELRKKIIYNIAFIESALDDPEHISIDGYSEKLNIINNEMMEELKLLLKNCDNGRIIKEGIKTVILGKPNAGKSSLLNTLLGEERAIVTSIAGTTRDILEENIYLNGISLNIIDTAGIRETDDIVEQIGVSRAKEHADKADLIIYVVDSSAPLDENDFEIMEFIKDRKAIILLNKSDLEPVVGEDDIRKYADHRIINISAKHNRGIEQLEEALNEMFETNEINMNDELYITNIRHKNAIQNAYDSLCLVKKSIEDELPEDFFSIDLMNAYEELGSIIGESVGEDLVNEIFSKFCMGK